MGFTTSGKFQQIVFASVPPSVSAVAVPYP